MPIAVDGIQRITA